MPGGCPSQDGEQWITTKHPAQKNRRKPFLVSNRSLGREFREQFLAGLRRLLKKGQLALEGSVAWLQDEQEREVWLRELEDSDWNVFIEGPPHGKSQPVHVAKYLARYMSGGPIADQRLISHEAGEVTFWARTKDKANQSQPFTLKGDEFVRRWSMHILPKGYTRSRSYGEYHCSKRADYLELCRRLLGVPNEAESSASSEPIALPEPSLPKCPRCETTMELIESSSKPSWREIFDVAVYREGVYSPTLHVHGGATSEAHSIGGYG